ncbi:hypothetical protein F0562_002496 [Nyssa sinensis]|uniref:Beta-carotene isomerase D27-like C-terminal domain-containing protein n=1 Tax=Nyssa sinensis TaxID=561372 RepID=A0A5J5C9P2_9ASTE|nr:hypothetical protein F0562_002496 [Nyssa sinensis]
MLVVQNKSPFSNWACRRHMQKPPKHSFSTVAVLTRPTDNAERVTKSNSSTVYKDSWFDRIAINHISQNLQTTTGSFHSFIYIDGLLLNFCLKVYIYIYIYIYIYAGLRNDKSGYESFVEAATVVSRNFNLIQQREIVLQTLEKAFPRPILSVIRAILPESKLAREYFAVFTTVFFAWLVGPCEVRESEFNGRREKNVVHVKKCRFLEESNCVGMCINLCKMPSQTFIKDSLGMPINMVPNFDDMSCEMIFGEEPPAPMDDPALKQPVLQTM